MQEISIDSRLSAIFEMVPKSKTVADIGTDHGKLPARLIVYDRCEKAILSDISKASLDKAIRLFEELDISDRAEFIVSDGLNNINQIPDCIVIAGMGSNTIINILKNGQNKLSNTLILSANAKEEDLRSYLNSIDYCISYEKIAIASNKIYIIIYAEKGKQSLSEKEIFIGKIFKENKKEYCIKYLNKKKNIIQNSIKGMENSSKPNIEEITCLKTKLDWINQDIEFTNKDL